MPRPAAAILVAIDRANPPPPRTAPQPGATASIEPIVLPVAAASPHAGAPPAQASAAVHDGTAEPAGGDVRSLQERLTEEFERGREDAALAARCAELERAEAALRQAEAERDAARQLWTEAEGDRLAAAIAAAFETLQREVSAAAAAALEPFLESALRDRVAVDFADQLRRACDHGAAAVALSGPPDLLDRIRAALGTLADRVAFDPCSRVEARAVVGRTTIETRIAAWLRDGAMPTDRREADSAFAASG